MDKGIKEGDRKIMKYRVDCFYSGKHDKEFFETETEARERAEQLKGKGHTFLLEERVDGFYDVLECIE